MMTDAVGELPTVVDRDELEQYLSLGPFGMAPLDRASR
jgi:hypothetical protein